MKTVLIPNSEVAREIHKKTPKAEAHTLVRDGICLVSESPRQDFDFSCPFAYFAGRTSVFGLIALAFASLALSAFGQGTVNIGTGAGAATKFITGMTGIRLGGPDYWAQLFWANGSVTDENAVVAAGSPVHPRTGAAAGVLPSGEVRMEGVTPPGGVVTLQLRAWSAVLGATEAEAFQNWLTGPAGTGCYGRSALFTMDTGNPLSSPPETPPSISAAFPGLTLYPCIPEPSTMVLGMLGVAGALVVLRRRKQ